MSVAAGHYLAQYRWLEKDNKNIPRNENEDNMIYDIFTLTATQFPPGGSGP
jgi:hypothetical protein